MNSTSVWAASNRVGSRANGLAPPPVRPEWLDDDGAVHRAIETKRTHPPSGHFWPRLAVLAQLGLEIVSSRAQTHWKLECAQRLLRGLQTELPTTTPTPWDPRHPGPLWWLLWRQAKPVADLAECVAALAVVLADPDPACPHLLAILLDEFAISLWMHRNDPTTESRAVAPTTGRSSRASSTIDGALRAPRIRTSPARHASQSERALSPRGAIR